MFINKHIYFITVLLFTWMVCFSAQTGNAQPTNNQPDSVSQGPSASTPKKKSKSAIESIITYSAKDSIYIDLNSQKTKLYRDAKMNYQKIDLTAGMIEVDFEKQQVKAQELLDTNGKLIGLPHFDDKEQNFNAKELLYNFKTKRGLIKDVITKEDEMYIHGNLVKKMENDVTYVKGAKFTTCDLEDPHFHIGAIRAKVIPDDKVVTGAAILYLEDMPMPIAVPFSLFPNTRRAKSGILLPAFGETRSQGFYLRGGGYFWNINDYMNVAFTGDIYTRGDFAVRENFSYAKRYKFRGSINMEYSQNHVGDPASDDYNSQNGYKVYWSHSQDAKSNPNSSFSANVNFYNSTYSRYSVNLHDYLNNQTNSSISYQTRLGELFNLSVTGGQSYNTNTQLLDMQLPSFSFSMNPIYPFKQKTRKGKQKWFETINFKYTLKGINELSAPDSSFFSKTTFENMRNGLQQDIPITSNITVLKFFNWNNSFSYTGKFYGKSYEMDVDTAFYNKGFTTSQTFSYSTGLSTKLYGMMQFKRFPLKAVRHMMTPSVGYSFHPDFGNEKWGYYQSYTDTTGKEHQYSIFTNSVYGGVPAPGKASNLNFSLGNNLEIKVRNRKDSITGFKKISLIDNLSVNTSYNMAADSLKWSPLTINGSSRLFNLINLNYGWRYDWYQRNADGYRINKFVWEDHNKLLLRENSTWSFSLGYTFNSKNKNHTPTLPDEMNPDMRAISPFYDNTPILSNIATANIPWSFSFDYTLSYGSYYAIDPVTKKPYYRKDTVQTLGFYGHVSLTTKWDIGFRSGYDFDMKKFTYTEIDIKRDLHCFEMSFFWVPFGDRQSWGFKIYAKSGLLRDSMKYEKNKSFRDNAAYY